MKKMICALALMAVAGTVSAQDKVVKKARLLKEEVQNLVANREKKDKEVLEMNQKLAQCMEMIEPTLTSPETKKELANAWDIKAQLHTYIFSPLLDNIINKQPTDTAKLAENIYAALDAMEQCYKATQELGLKGDKDPYTMPNQLQVLKFRPYVAYCGQMFFQNAQASQNQSGYAKAVDAFKRWMNYPTTYTILGSNAAALAEDDQTSQIAYFTCLSAYFAKDYKTLLDFIPQAKQYTQEKDQVNQLLMTVYLEQGDTVNWLKTGKDIVLEDPSGNEGIAQNVLAYYFSRDDAQGALSFTEELLSADAESKIGNYAKGLVYMNDHKYADAIPFFIKATEADDSFSDAHYNAGVCYSNIGYDLNDALTGKKMTPAQQKAEIDKVKAEYAKAEPFFLKVKELEPENPHKWASRLSTVYYILGDKDRQAEMEKLLND